MTGTATLSPNGAVDQIFPLPTKEEAAYLSRELNWGEHFIGSEMNPAAGNRDVYLFSFKEAVQFLQYGTAGMGLSSGGRGTISWIDTGSFVDWVRACIGDTLLADAIAGAIADVKTYHGQVQHIGHLLSTRYNQINEALAEDDES